MNRDVNAVALCITSFSTTKFIVQLGKKKKDHKGLSCQKKTVHKASGEQLYKHLKHLLISNSFFRLTMHFG